MSSKILIDSHILVWLLYEPDKITAQARDILQNADVVYFSPVSLWELTLKFSKGKLAYEPTELAQGVEALNLDRLQLRDVHITAILDIQLPHKDPFDTLLIAQSETEGCTFLTADGHILESTYNTFGCR
jgi:PIN domain nuclease of toxin-antitoxin system